MASPLELDYFAIYIHEQHKGLKGVSTLDLRGPLVLFGGVLQSYSLLSVAKLCTCAMQLLLGVGHVQACMHVLAITCA